MFAILHRVFYFHRGEEASFIDFSRDLLELLRENRLGEDEVVGKSGSTLLVVAVTACVPPAFEDLHAEELLVERIVSEHLHSHALIYELLF